MWARLEAASMTWYLHTVEEYYTAMKMSTLKLCVFMEMKLTSNFEQREEKIDTFYSIDTVYLL